MANVIKIKKSSVPGQAPSSAQLETAELAINLVDQKMYTKDAANNVFTLAAHPIDSVANTSTDVPASANSVKTAYDTAIAFSIALG